MGYKSPAIAPLNGLGNCENTACNKKYMIQAGEIKKKANSLHPNCQDVFYCGVILAGV